MKNYKILILLIILLLGIGLYSRFYSKKSVTTQAEKTDYFDLKNKKIKVSSIDFGDTQAIKQAKVKTQDAQELAQKFGFTKSGERGTNSLNWQLEGKNLIVTASSSFSFSTEMKESQTSLGSVGEAEKKARDYLTNLGIVTGELKFNLVDTRFIKEGRDLSPDFKGANYLAFDFGVTFQDRPIYFQINGQNQFQVLIDKNGNILKLSGPLPMSVTDIENSVLRNGSDATGELRAGQGQIIQIKQVQAPSANLAENLSYSEVTFKKGQISYLVKSGQLIPVFDYLGEAKNPDNKTIEIHVQLPALKSS